MTKLCRDLIKFSINAKSDPCNNAKSLLLPPPVLVLAPSPPCNLAISSNG